MTTTTKLTDQQTEILTQIDARHKAAIAYYAAGEASGDYYWQFRAYDAESEKLYGPRWSTSWFGEHVPEAKRQSIRRDLRKLIAAGLVMPRKDGNRIAHVKLATVAEPSVAKLSQSKRNEMVAAILRKLGIPNGLPQEHAAEGAAILRRCISSNPIDLTDWQEFVKAHADN